MACEFSFHSLSPIVTSLAHYRSVAMSLLIESHQRRNVGLEQGELGLSDEEASHGPLRQLLHLSIYLLYVYPQNVM